MKPLLLLFCALSVNTGIYSQSLFPGMQAPALEVEEWVKGSPVTHFDKDSIYVVEFWATWCGPCKTAIPHLTELATQYPKTRIVGVSVWESNTKNVKPFVQQTGDKMGYTVAIDKQDSDTAREGYMTRNWLQAAGLNGIPATFVIDKNQIAWIGHPMALDSVLESMNKGNWNTERFAKQWKKEKAEETLYRTRMEQYRQKLRAHVKDKQKKQFYKTLDEQLKYLTTLKAGGGWQMVNEHIWYWLADPASKGLTPEMKDYTFGVKWMEALTARPEGKNAGFYDTLAWCYYGAGQKQKAIDLETKAIEMLPANDGYRADFENALKTFQQ
jgi:thiol-disulfide isomerase/thioredoxin